VEARVEGRKITCILDGKTTVSSDFLDEKLDSGGIGIKTWNREPGQARLTVKHVSVETI